MKKSTNNKGFTLIELIVVIAIIAILAAVAVPSYGAIQERAQQSADLANAQLIVSTANNFNALVDSTAAITVANLDACAGLTAFNVLVAGEDFSLSGMPDADYRSALGYITATMTLADPEAAGFTVRTPAAAS